LGSASAPTIAFTGDIDTGIYSPGANQVAISTGGTQRATIDSSGRLLVGTSSVVGTSADNSYYALLTVKGAATSSGAQGQMALVRGEGSAAITAGETIGRIVFADSNAGNYALIDCTADGTAGSGDYPGRLVFATTADGASSPTERLRITSDGKLGLGTSSPSERLTVSGNISCNGTLDLTDSTIDLYSQTTNAASKTYQQFSDIGGTQTEQVYFKANGEAYFRNSVGVGTTSPSSLLQLTGSGVGANYLVINASSSGSETLEVGVPSGGGNVQLTATHTGGGSNSAGFIFRTRAGSSGTAERARIDSSGRLGLGTSAPASFLHVDSDNTYGSVVLSRDGGAAGRRPFGIGISGATDANLRISASNDTTGANAFTTQLIDITADGKVGIGTTSPAGNLGVQVDTGKDVTVGLTSGSPMITYRNGSGAWFHVGKHPTSDALIFSNGATTTTNEMARFDNAGRLLVGTSSSRAMFGSVNNRVQIEGDGHANSSLSLTRTGGGAPQINLASSANTSFGLVSSGNDLGLITFMGADGTAMRNAAEIYAEVDGTPGAGDMPGRLVFGTTADGASSPTERMRVDSAGTVLIGATSFPGAGTSTTGVGFGTSGSISVHRSLATPCFFGRSNDGEVIALYSGTTQRGTVSISGATTTYGSVSDYRLKENIAPISGAASKVSQLKPSKFNFIEFPEQTVDGFIAHEVQEVVPEAVIGSKDAIDEDGKPIYQSIDQSKLVPLLTAALQEALAKIETLEQRLSDAGIA
jgi:hypothetical protein